jgi:hypothetical protein
MHVSQHPLKIKIENILLKFHSATVVCHKHPWQLPKCEHIIAYKSYSQMSTERETPEDRRDFYLSNAPGCRLNAKKHM